MRTNDIYFRPGDKVMRVMRASHAGTYPLPVVSGPKMGIIYCVEDFYEGPMFNAVMLVGFGGWRRHPDNGTPVGWRACWFRKVDEIKLCLAAVQQTPVAPEPALERP